jgi:hypothetical protein
VAVTTTEVATTTEVVVVGLATTTEVAVAGLLVLGMEKGHIAQIWLHQVMANNL